ncbi:MAG: hypothetical protein NC102_08920 [Clostridium sp.]|nr:hypothetical protein [Clostridium sp.]
MTDEDKKRLAADTDGLAAYEYIANHIEDGLEDIDAVIDYMARADSNGQILASTAKYLHAIDPDKFAKQIQRLVEATIEKDREHRYLADILIGIYGPDYETRAQELNEKDNNFRRIYKRLYPNTPI